MHCTLPPRAPSVPAPIVIRTTDCGYFKLLPGGRVVRWHAQHWPGIARAGEGVWVRHTGGRLTLVRRGRVFWRSRLNHGSDAVVVHGRTIAYANYPTPNEPSEETWLARVGGGQRRIARNESPLGWTTAGLLLLERGRTIDVRDSTGRHRASFRVRLWTFDNRTSTLVAVTYDHRLVRTDGRSTTTLMRIHDHRWLLQDVLPNGLVVLTRPGGVLVLDAHGHHYASGSFSRFANLGGAVTPLPDGSMALSAMRMRKHDLIDTVLLLHGSRSLPLVTRHLPLSCGHWTTLTYRAGRILYSSQGRVVLLDPKRRRAAVDLTAFAQRLASRADDAAAYWG